MPIPQERPLRRVSDKVKQEAMKPEARLMSAIMGEWLDSELRQEIDGLSLMEALMRQIEAVERDLRNCGSPGFASRCRRLAMLRFGFADGRSWLQREIALEFGLTPRRVGEIESRLLRILRLPNRISFLKPFINE